MSLLKGVLIFSTAALLFGCGDRVDNSSGRATVYEDASSASSTVQGLGVESQDIQSVTDKMIRDIMTSSTLFSRDVPARVIIDSEYFVNESSSIINKNLLTDRLRINLNRASQGRLVFVGRHFIDMVEKERELKRSGTVDSGTIRQTQATAGADFRMGGRIASLDAINSNSQEKSRYTQITFELIDLEYGTIVWSDIYDFRKSSQDDVIYR